MSELPQLSADPLQIIRSFPITMVRPEQIRVSKELPTDPIFVSKYKAFSLGRVPIHESRISLSSIRRGFWRVSGRHFELIGEKPQNENVQLIKELIQLGSRPVLFIYDNPNSADEKRYVCTDDIATHAAYEELGISVVPISLLGKPKDMEESCISVRAFRKNTKESIHLIEGFVPTIHKLLPSILGGRELAISKSLDAVLKTKTMLRDFHRPGAVKFHYHHTLYSVLLRAEDTLESMKMLVESGKILVAASLLRALHELVLTFYIDWLSPGQTYKYLQLASVMSEKDWEKSCNETMQEQIKMVYQKLMRGS